MMPRLRRRLANVASIGLAAGVCLLFSASAAADPAPAGTATLNPNKAGVGTQLSIDAEGPGGGLLPGQVPSGLAFWLQKGFVLNPSAVPGVCSNADAKNDACPAASRFAAGTIDVAISGLLTENTTARVALYVTQPQQTGDPAGAAFSFSVSSPAQVSGTALGRIINVTDPTYATEIRFDQLPIPSIPPGLRITLQNLKLTTVAPDGTLPSPTPTSSKLKKKQKHKHKRKRKRRRRRPRAKRAHKAAAPFLTNPPSCSGAFTVRLQVFYGSATQERDAAVPCTN